MKREPYTLEEHVNSITARLDRVERRPMSAGAGGGAEALPVFIQAYEPADAPIGSLWLDTDASCQQ